MQFKNSLMYWQNILPPSSELKSGPGKEPAKQAAATCFCGFPAWLTLGSVRTTQHYAVNHVSNKSLIHGPSTKVLPFLPSAYSLNVNILFTANMNKTKPL
jgi:hypothetical protein